MNCVDIFNYLNPISYLEDQLKLSKSKNITIQDWTKAMSLKSPSLIVDILSSKKKIQVKHVEVFNKVLKLTSSEREFFTYLILFHNAKENDEKYTFKKLMTDVIIADESKDEKLDEIKGNQLSSWIDYALISFYMADTNHTSKEELLSLFKFDVTQNQIDQSLDKLLKLNILEDTGSGFIVHAHNISTKNDVSILGSREYYKEVADLSKEAIEIPLDEREFQCFALSIDEENLKELKEEFRFFKKKLIYLAGEDKRDRLYQFNLQMFPLTGKINSQKQVLDQDKQTQIQI